jgi:hypothetical protein
VTKFKAMEVLCTLSAFLVVSQSPSGNEPVKVGAEVDISQNKMVAKRNISGVWVPDTTPVLGHPPKCFYHI